MPASRTRRSAAPSSAGWSFATFATLLLVPIFYTLLRKSAPALHTLDQRFAAEAAGASKEALGHG